MIANIKNKRALTFTCKIVGADGRYYKCSRYKPTTSSTLRRAGKFKLI